VKVISVYTIANPTFCCWINTEFSQEHFVPEGFLYFSGYKGEHFYPQEVLLPWLNQLPL
jgi:hypothetical protein